MSIEEFHSKVQLPGESDALFTALRLLRVVDPGKLVRGDDIEPHGGWDPWSAL